MAKAHKSGRAARAECIKARVVDTRPGKMADGGACAGACSGATTWLHERHAGNAIVLSSSSKDEAVGLKDDNLAALTEGRLPG